MSMVYERTVSGMIMTGENRGTQRKTWFSITFFIT